MTRGTSPDEKVIGRLPGITVPSRCAALMNEVTFDSLRQSASNRRALRNFASD